MLKGFLAFLSWASSFEMGIDDDEEATEAVDVLEAAAVDGAVD